MLLAFNQYGTLIRQLTHGYPARQGLDHSEGGFEIVCYFQGVNVNNYTIATITFERPDGTVIETTYSMTYKPDYEFYREDNDDINTDPFMEGTVYKVFKYIVSEEAIFSQYGTYKATVSLYLNSVSDVNLLVMGTMNIPVQKSAYEGDTTITISQYNVLVSLITGKLNINDDIYLRVVHGLPASFNTAYFNAGDIVLNADDKKLYQLSATKQPVQIELDLSGITLPDAGSIYLLNNKVVATTDQVDAKQDALTPTQMAAVNSGVTSTKVTAYDAHITNTNNPHNVTKAQLGLDQVVNTGDSATPVSGGTTKFTTGGAYVELQKKANLAGGNTFTGPQTVDNKIVFTDTANPIIQFTTGGTPYYVQAYDGKVGIGPGWVNSTKWSSNGVASFTAVPNVNGTNVALTSDIPIITGKANLDGGNDFTGVQTVTNGSFDTVVINRTSGVPTIKFATNSGNLYLGNYGVDANGNPYYYNAVSDVEKTLAYTSDLPTKTSDLTNDSGFITKTVSDLTNYTKTSDLAAVATSGSYNDLINKPTIPDVSGKANLSGGNTFEGLQIIVGPDDTPLKLKSNHSTDSNIEFNNNSGTRLGNIGCKQARPYFWAGVGGTTDYIALSGDVPTATSDLTNDSGFITKDVNNLTNYTKTSSLSTVATSGSYADLSNKPSIPTKTSDITNDSGFITKSVSDLTNYTTTSALNTALAGKENADATILKQANVVNTLNNTSTIYPLSANMGKELNDKITNIESRGRYLATWNCGTGLPDSFPVVTSYPYTYTYRTGDYYIVSSVPGSGTKYMPDGASISKQSASAAWVVGKTTTTATIAENDTYIYDGTSWSLIHTPVPTVSFSSIAGQPTDNTNLAAALNAKQNVINSSNKLSASYVLGLASVATTGAYSDLTGRPTTVSSFTNDSGYITKSVSDLTNYTKTEDLATVATSGSYNDLSNKPSIPTKTSDITNDSGFITKSVNNLDNYTKTSSLATVATSGSYTDLSDKPSIPTKTSDITNDSGYITKSVNNLDNYTTTTALNTALAAKANDNAVVHLTGDETVGGTKTFGTRIFGSYNNGVNGIQIYGADGVVRAQFGVIDGYYAIVGTGAGLQTLGTVYPTTNNVYDLGTSTRKYKNIHLSGEITDDTNSITVAKIENSDNKVTALSGSSTNAQYPSAKVVYDTVPKVIR